MRLLENDSITLEDAGFRDEDSILVSSKKRKTQKESLREIKILDERMKEKDMARLNNYLQ